MLPGFKQYMREVNIKVH